MKEEHYIVAPGKQPLVKIAVCGSVITDAPEPISRFKFKNIDWALDTFRRYGWVVEKVDEEIGV